MLSDEQTLELERCLRVAGDEGQYPVVVSGRLMRSLGSAHDDAVRLREDVSKWKRAWIGRADEASEWRDALHRSPYDISPCMECGKPVVCIPDGMPMCEPCGAALRPAGQGGGEDGDWNEGVRLSGKAD